MNSQDINLRIGEIASRVSRCFACTLSKTRNQTVPGEGNPTSRIMFIGEAPGSNEDKQGTPFMGRAGNVLDQLLQSIGLDRKDVFITNLVKCRPPKNRDPKVEELNSCSNFLDDQIIAINPSIIVTLGRFSFAKFFPDLSLNRSRGHPHLWNGINIFPMYHPAAALYNPALRPRLELDFSKIPQLLDNFLKADLMTSKTAPDVTERQLGLFD